MKLTDVITLEDDKNYLLFDELEYNNEVYFAAMGINEEDVDGSDVMFVKPGVDEEGDYIDVIEEEGLFMHLLQLYMDKHPEFKEDSI